MNFSNIKFLFFDLDGTLTDSGKGISRCVAHALEKQGIRENCPEKLHRFVGPPLMQSFSKYYHLSPEACVQAIEDFRERYVRIGIFENELYPKVKETLEALQSRGYVLAVATSKPKVFAKKVLEFFEIDRYFSYIEGPPDDEQGTKADVLREVLLQAKPKDLSEVIMIGDTIFDKVGARETNLAFLACDYGYGLAEDLSDAEYHIECFEELLNIFPGTK